MSLREHTFFIQWLQQLRSLWMRRRNPVLGIGALVVLAVLLLLRNASSTGSSPSSDAAEIIVQEQAFESTLSVSGLIDSEGRAAVTSPFDGLIERRLADFGAQVAKDQVLFVLDPSETLRRVEEARIAMMKAEQSAQSLRQWATSSEVSRAARAVLTARMQLADTQRKARESVALVERGIVPRAESDGYLEQVRNQEMQLASAEEDLHSIRERGNAVSRQIAESELESALQKYAALERSVAQREIRAPLAGVLMRAAAGDRPIAVSLDPGTRVAAGQVLFHIAPLDVLGARARVDEIDVVGLALMQDVMVSITAAGELPPLRGRISHISAQALGNPESGANTALFEIRIELPPLSEAQRRSVRVGMTCSLAIVQYRNPRAILVPLSFVWRDRDTAYAAVRRSDGTIEQRRIEPGRTSGNRLEVLHGLKPGERVVKPDAGAA